MRFLPRKPDRLIRLAGFTAIGSAVLLGLFFAPLDARADNPVELTYNWAGVVAKHAYYGGVFTQLRLPVVKPTPIPNGFAAWVGIGGLDSDDLIQAGVEIDNGQTACVWYELLPDIAHCVGNFALAPGNLTQITIAELSPDQWQIQVVNGPQAWEKTFHYQSSHSTAEWVVEPKSHISGATFQLPTADITFCKMAAVVNGDIAFAGSTTPTIAALVNNLGEPRATGWATVGEPAGTSYTIHTYGN